MNPQIADHIAKLERARDLTLDALRSPPTASRSNGQWVAQTIDALMKLGDFSCFFEWHHALALP